MLTVTPSAMNHITNALVGSEPTAVLRLTATDEGLALVPDQPQQEDEVHEHLGEPRLVVAPIVSEAVDGKTLDVEVEGESARLTLR